MAFVIFGIATPRGAAASVISFCSPGSEPGQCSNPRGVGVDTGLEPEPARVYVSDRNNDRVNVFEIKEGEGKLEFVESFGEGVVDNPEALAVDSDLHLIYVYDSGNSRVVQFDEEGNVEGEATGFNASIDKIAVGPGNEVYVSDMLKFAEEPQVKRYDTELIQIGECELEQQGRLNGGLAVGGSGDLYATFGSGGGIFKFDWAEPVCPELTDPLEPELFTQPLGVADGGDLYGQNDSGGFGRVITRYSLAGAVLRRFGYGDLNTTIPGIAPFESAFGDVFASEQNGPVKYLREPPAGPLSAATSASAGNVRATLSAQINPEGKATEWAVQYLTEAQWEESGESFAGPNTPKEATGEIGAADFELHEAKAEIGCPEPLTEAELPESPCLSPDTEYRYQVLYSNPDGAGDGPREGSFETKDAVEIIDTWASEVGVDSARLSATADPVGIPAIGYFEYVDQETYEATEFEEATEVPAVGKGAGPLDFGGGEGGVTRSTVVELEPGTTYHLRVVVEDPLIEPKTGEEVVFHTFEEEAIEPCANAAFRGGPSAYLPDCRAYELVSPLDKEGGEILALPDVTYNLPSTLNQSDTMGDKVAYGTYKAFGDAESAPFTSQYIAQRNADDWSSHFILGPRAELTMKAGGALNSEVKAFSPDLCESWFRTAAEPPLELTAGMPGQPNLYRRTDELCGEESYEAITTAPFPIAHENPGLELQGAAENGAAIYAVRDSLAGTGAPAQPLSCVEDDQDCRLELYYQEAGEGPPRYACVLPDGTAHPGACAGGTTPDRGGGGRTASVIGALAEDGERVFWSTKGGEGAGKIYVRMHPGAPQSAGVGCAGAEAGQACTDAVSAAAEGVEGSEKSQFWAAAKDGSAALFTTGGTLYRYEVGTGETIAIAEGAVGVMGASEYLSRVYFASTLDLGAGPNPVGGEAVAGEPNLYLREEGGGTAFVATLVMSSDVTSQHAAINAQPVNRTARVSADGLHAAFMSTAPITGYDNTDAKSGEADTEVFVYDAEAERLACVSCNPSGGRPAGQVVSKITVEDFWGAGQLPPWPSTLYQGRLLSDDGQRLYFESSDALVPRDSNGRIDVYQWEAPGRGGCDEGDPSYSARNEGCVELVSSGQSGGDAIFADASPTGDDVFFTTAASLLPQDYGLTDLYDARAGGGQPVPPTPPAECEGESCQSPPPPPDPPVLGSLGEGPGNLAPPKAKKKHKKCAKSKRKVKRGGKVRCVKKKRAKKHAKRHARHHRAKRAAGR
ncbi:MAG: hypothetical protein R2725_03280 [Solirubrobacterales bacterium]